MHEPEPDGGCLVIETREWRACSVYQYLLLRPLQLQGTGLTQQKSRVHRIPKQL